jgi:hypothetical protein
MGASSHEAIMAFTFKKISNYGTTNPVVARLNVQTHDLLQWADLPQQRRDDVFGIYDGMKNRLLKCHEAQSRLCAALDETLSDDHFNPDGTLKSRPYLIGLENEVETILYEQKNFLRDLLKVVNIFFNTEFDEASAFYDAKTGGDGKLTKWAKEALGGDDPFPEMLQHKQGWIGEVIRKRNAAEHPGGKSGTLHIVNFEQAPDGRFNMPVWYRDDMPPTGIFPDLEDLLDNLLTLAEDVLVSCIVHKNKHVDMIAFVGIPEQERDKKCPKRIRAVPGEAMRKLLKS